MDGTLNQKEKLVTLIKGLEASLDSETGKKIEYKKLERVCSRLIEYFDECKECQEYVDKIIICAENTSNFSDLNNKQEMLNYRRTIKAIVSHMEKKHKLFTEGYYMGTYMCIGISIGAGLGVALNNVALWISIGLCLGLAIGSGIDADYKKRGQIL
jgi:hypothetical protein